MFVRRATVFILAGVFAACSGDQGNQAEEGMAEHATEMASPEQALQNLAASYAEHVNAGQPDMVAAMYGDSAVVLAADGTIASGKEQIAAWIQQQQAASPNVTVTPAEQMVEGDVGIQRGTYSVTATPPGGTATTQSGNYITVSRKTGDEWKIGLLITSFDAPPPEGFVYQKYEGENPPEDGTMKEHQENWATHFNLGHADMVADLFTPDAKVAFGGAPAVEGHDAIQSALTTLMGGGGGQLPDNKPQITIHDVHTQEFGPDHNIDVGWYETTVDGKPNRTGEYLTLNQKQADGTWKTMWAINNGRPAAM